MDNLYPIIPDNEYLAMKDLSKEINLDIDQWDPFLDAGDLTQYAGYKVSQNHIVGIQLTNYELTRIPESISDLTRLTKLDLYYNQLTILPDQGSYTSPSQHYSTGTSCN